jgi:hypothetical protein
VEPVMTRKHACVGTVLLLLLLLLLVEGQLIDSLYPWQTASNQTRCNPQNVSRWPRTTRPLSVDTKLSVPLCRPLIPTTRACTTREGGGQIHVDVPPPSRGPQQHCPPTRREHLPTTHRILSPTTMMKLLP